MEAGATETRAEKAARIRPELLRLLLDFDPPEEERSGSDKTLMTAKGTVQRQLQEEQTAEAERRRIESQRAHDRRPLGSRFQDTNKQTREGGGLPEGSIIPSGITHDLVLKIDLPARRMEREERLLAFNGGDVNETLADICEEGGGKDARFLLAHGADANHHREANGVAVLARAALNGRLSIVDALLDAGAGQREWALSSAAAGGHTAVVALLLDRGADIHYRDDWALWYTAHNGHLETATLLLQRGASATNPTNRILAVAVRRGHHAIADLLRAHGAV